MYTGPQARQRKKAKYDKAKALYAVNSNPGYLRIGGAYGMGVPGSPEQKYSDTAIAVAGTNSATQFIYLNTVAQNSTSTGRVGAKIQVTRISLRLRINRVTQSEAGSGESTAIRCIIFIDKQANGNPPTAAELLTYDDHNSFYQLSNTNRFIILKDKMFNLAPAAAIQTAAGTGKWGMPATYWKWSRKLSLPISYSSTNGTVGEVKSNCLWLAHVALNTTGAINGYTRIRYLDS